MLFRREAQFLLLVLVAAATSISAEPQLVDELPDNDYFDAASFDEFLEEEPPNGGAPEVLGTDPGTASVYNLAASEGDILWNNGPFVTGIRQSELQTEAGLIVFGYNVKDFSLADDFEVADPLGWHVQAFTFMLTKLGLPQTPP
jgi:hypothetical protein